jgi:hypothetical protein
MTGVVEIKGEGRVAKQAREAAINDFAAEHFRPYKRSMKHRLASGETALRYALENFRWHDGDHRVVKSRTLRCQIAHNDELIGGIVMTQYAFPNGPCFDNEDFLLWMDINSREESSFAEVLNDVWTDIDFELAAYGSVVYLNRVFSTQRLTGQPYWVQAVETVLNQVFSDYAILVFKAFPLEHEARQAMSGFPLSEARLASRLSAMRRYYSRILDVQLMPGEAGLEGWMWRARPAIKRSIKPTSEICKRPTSE